ncbi:hypothetical protein YTPLAS18_29880 [Nitrospira sp.]|nr:hypothetical protein YTPLAS18_29880 [Nitrospira sp.]
MADRLIEDQLDRDAGIRAGKDGCKRFLFMDGMLFEHDEIMLDRGQLIGGESVVACKQSPQRGSGTESALSPNRGRRGELNSSLRGNPGHGPYKSPVQELPSPDI